MKLQANPAMAALTHVLLDVHASMDYHPQLQNFLSSFCFLFTAAFTLLSLLLCLLRLGRPWCSCEVCQTYITSRWRAEYDNLCDWYTHLLRRSPTKTIHLHILGNVVTANPSNVEHMLKTRFDNYPKGKPFSAILGDLLGVGIFNVDGDQWRFQRKMASLELGSVSIRSYAFSIISAEIGNRLIPLLKVSAAAGDAVLDLQDLFRRFAFDNICKISFGLDPGCLDLSLPMSEFAAAFDLATLLSAKRAALPLPAIWKMKRLLNLGSEKQLKEAIGSVNAFAEEVIRQRRKRLGSDLLSRFMATIDDDRYLRDIVVSFLLAGRDTVASGLTSFFWLLAKHPQVETAIREEIRRFVSHDAAAASLEELREMHYLHAAMYESMRLYPPVQMDSKFPLQDDVLPDGTAVLKGTRVTYHPFAMGRMEEIWGEDCLEFKPERWLKAGKFMPECPFKYPIFQAGLRDCIGKEMAVLEIKSVAAALLPRFRIRVSESADVGPKFAPGLTATLNGGLPVTVDDLFPSPRP